MENPRAWQALAQPLATRSPAGGLVELSGRGATARVTTAVSLLRLAQGQGEPAAWIQRAGGSLYPPDLGESGIDLDALVVVHVPPSAGTNGLLRAAELLVGSGAFGVVVLDLEREAPRGDAWQARLSALARAHESCVLLLTDKPPPVASLGTFVGLRIHCSRTRKEHGRFLVEHRVLKKKPGIELAPMPALHRGPWGIS